MRRAADGALRTRDAVALGLLHGPAELLPVSSSGHVAVVPWLLDWPYQRLDGELRKAFEVALHAGTAAALVVGLRDELAHAARGLDRRRAQLIVLSFVPPALVGCLLERPIERRLGTPATTAAGLLVDNEIEVDHVYGVEQLSPGVEAITYTFNGNAHTAFASGDAGVFRVIEGWDIPPPADREIWRGQK